MHDLEADGVPGLRRSVCSSLTAALAVSAERAACYGSGHTSTKRYAVVDVCSNPAPATAKGSFLLRDSTILRIPAKLVQQVRARISLR
jgi:hypothetical protein